MNSAPLAFKQWCDFNRLTLNISKSKLMIISNSNQIKLKEMKNLIKIEIGGVAMEIVSEYKYFGITLNESLNFVSHMKMIKTKVLQRTYL